MSSASRQTLCAAQQEKEYSRPVSLKGRTYV
jgi:hypothetical protein